MEGIPEEEITKFKEKFPKFYATIFATDDWFGGQLKIAALYIMSYELFQDYVEEQFKFFFSSEWKRNKKGELVGVLGQEFEEAKARYSKRKKSTLFDAACNWFEEMEVFDGEDRKVIAALKELRDELAHQLFKILASEDYPELDKQIINGPINQYYKVSNWWIRNFEASIAPEDYEQFDNEAMNSATAMQVQILMMLTKRI